MFDKALYRSCATCCGDLRPREPKHSFWLTRNKLAHCEPRLDGSHVPPIGSLGQLKLVGNDEEESEPGASDSRPPSGSSPPSSTCPSGGTAEPKASVEASSGRNVSDCVREKTAAGSGDGRGFDEAIIDEREYAEEHSQEQRLFEGMQEALTVNVVSLFRLYDVCTVRAWMRALASSIGFRILHFEYWIWPFDGFLTLSWIWY